MAGSDTPFVNTSGLTTTNTSLPPSGSDSIKAFSLKKKVFSSKQIKESLGKGFKLLANSPFMTYLIMEKTLMKL